MLNEAIIQSLLEQENANVDQETIDQENQILKEVLKMSSLEHQKKTGQLDLASIKRKRSGKTSPAYKMPSDHELA